MNRESVQGLLLFTIAVAVATVALWPVESYSQLVRFGIVPPIVTALPYLVALLTIAAATHLSLADPAIPPALRATLSTILSLPMVSIGLVMARTGVGAATMMVGYLWMVALFSASLAALWTRIADYPSIVRLGGWGSIAVVLILAVRFAPDYAPSRVVRELLQPNSPLPTVAAGGGALLSLATALVVQLSNRRRESP